MGSIVWDRSLETFSKIKSNSVVIVRDNFDRMRDRNRFFAVSAYYDKHEKNRKGFVIALVGD